jgi:hypothetical protein
MSDREKKIIPLQDAQKVFSTFGIGPDNPEYRRWRREDGFRHVDLEDVLDTSHMVLVVDWREWLQDAVDKMAEQLAALDIPLTAELGEEGEQGTVEVDGIIRKVKYIPDDDDDFDDVMEAINLLIKGRAGYRKFRSSEGSDGWRYAVLKDEDWQMLVSSVPDLIQLLFVNPGPLLNAIRRDKKKGNES